MIGSILCWAAALLLLSLLQPCASSDSPEAPVPVVQLGDSNYTSYLEGLDPEHAVLMEFYANWCPHCRHFAPTYEQVGQVFVTEQAAVVVARADCASTAAQTCKDMQVASYPSVTMGRAAQFLDALVHGTADSGVQKAQAENKKSVPDIVADVLTFFDLPPLSVEALAAASDNATHATPSPTPTPAQPRTQTSPPPAAQTPPSHALARDLTSATVQTYHEILEADGSLYQERQPFLDFWGLVQTAHPVPACRDGAAALLELLPIWWPEGAAQLWKPPKEMRALDVCGEEGRAQGAEWEACAGSSADTRGYTCGLWMLSHSLLANLPQGSDPAPWHAGLRAFIERFFRCEECRGHFLEMLDAMPADAAATRDAAALWFWQAHNAVNERLAREEAEQGTGDPRFPKIQFPPPDLCPLCRAADGTWHRPEVLAFLHRFYGPPPEPPAQPRPEGGDTHIPDALHRAVVRAPGDLPEPPTPRARARRDAAGEYFGGDTEKAKQARRRPRTYAQWWWRSWKWFVAVGVLWGACLVWLFQPGKKGKRGKRGFSLLQPIL